MPKRKPLVQNWGRAITIIAILAILYLARPLFHGTVMGLYKNPSMVVFLLLVVFLLRTMKRGALTLFMGGAVARPFKSMGLLVFIIIIFFLGMGVVESAMKPIAVSNSLEWGEIGALPSVSPEHLRITPEQVSILYSKAALPYPEYKMGNTDLVNADGSLMWSTPIVPDGLVNMFRLNDRGFMLVDATTIDKKITETELEFAVGEGVLLTKAAWWQLWERDYFIDLGDWYFLPVNDSGRIIVPAIKYNFHLWAVWPYTVPDFKGVYEIYPDGSIEFHSTADIEAGDIPSYLKSNPLYPREIARFYTSTFSWKRGLANILFFHEDQIEIRDPWPERQPFLILSEEGFSWLLAAEPWGEAHGVNRIFLFDGTTGEISVRELEEPLLGPIRAMGVLESELPIRAFNRLPVEPLPVIADGKLYWRVMVAPEELTSVAYLALVDASTNEIYTFEKDEEFFAFVAGEAVPVPTTTEEEPTIKEELQQLRQEVQGWLEKLEELEGKVG